MTKTYDLLNMGRSGIDLYSNDVGVPFPDIKSFAAYVGGSPTNICVGAHRLGLKTALLTGVGNDPVGDFVLQFLNAEGIETRFIPRKGTHRTGAAVLGIEPPDKFPLVFYRENCADINLTIDDVLAAPVTDCKVFQFAGTNLSKEPSRSATMFAAEQAREAGAKVVLDVDFRPDQWHDVRAFGVSIRAVLPLVDIVIGTEDEINAALLRDQRQIRVKDMQVSDTRVAGELPQAIATILKYGPEALALKTGSRGATIFLTNGEKIEAPGYQVDVYNILGAGDAFGGGFLYGYVNDWGWYKAARLGNACGAIIVTKHGCANFMPTLAEVESFTASRGGL
ncbi:MAG TPA: 5-dehydro-2-deoxygluconokinase [Aggregatilineales bacterium]|nr:5-dehydro-2-deoxygluconokinase [Aggregatilineales bacterium]